MKADQVRSSKPSGKLAPPGFALADAWPAAFIAVELVGLAWLLLRDRAVPSRFRRPQQEPIRTAAQGVEL
ncbi:MAG: hypothetical protein ACYDGR_00840 [Candidatus Dormibacteria bacterium]